LKQEIESKQLKMPIKAEAKEAVDNLKAAIFDAS
jgi:hypothetical protein